MPKEPYMNGYQRQGVDFHRINSLMIDVEVTESRFRATEVGPEVSAILMLPRDAFALMAFGHGAGTPMRHPVMVGMADALARQGVASFRFNYPYSERGKEADWRRSLDSLNVLLATACSAVIVAAKAAPALPLFVGGRSMSSQLISLAAADGMMPAARGVILFAFPMRWQKLLADPVAHLKNVFAPMLFVQGNRDDLTDLDELQPILDSLGKRATLQVVDGVDHFYNPPESSGRTQQDVLSEVAATVRNWMISSFNG